MTLTDDMSVYSLKKGDSLIMLKDEGNYSLKGEGVVMVSFVTPACYSHLELAYLDN